MTEHGIFAEIAKYGAYAVVAVLGFFFRRHTEKADKKESEQDMKLDTLDKRLDGHDVSRADIRAQIAAIQAMLLKIDRNIDKLLDRK